MRSLALVSLLSLVVVAASGCAGKDVPVEEIPKLKSLKDLMDAQAGAADPQFGKAKQVNFTDAEFAAFADSARRLQATSGRLKEFSKGPEFDTYALKLGENAAALLSAAESKNVQMARDSLVNMKAVCKDCHKRFK